VCMWPVSKDLNFIDRICIVSCWIG